MKKSIIAILLLSSAAAFANEAADEQANRTPFTGSMSRTEVKAAVVQAQAGGALRYDEFAGHRPQAGDFVRTRAEVRGDAVQTARSRAIHELY